MKNQLLHQSVANILFFEWDPIGVKDNPECRNEYDAYAQTICRLLKEVADEYKLAAHLHQLQEVSMGLFVIDDEHNRHIAQRLKSLLA